MTVERVCPVCSRVYEADPQRLKWGRQTTCGRSCSYKARATARTAAVVMTCGTCGRQFSRAPSAIKSKHGTQFCSRECHYRGRSLGLSKRVVTEPYAHSESTLEQFSRDMVFGMARGLRVRTDAKFEDEVSEALARFGIAHVRQFPLYDRELRRWYACDFFLPELNTVIEVNCNASHVDPRVPARSTRAAQRQRLKERDEARRAAAVREGHIFRELWETELRQGVNDAVRSAIGIS